MSEEKKVYGWLGRLRLECSESPNVFVFCRDGFYEFYRLWRSHSNDLEWFMDSKEMVEKIR